MKKPRFFSSSGSRCKAVWIQVETDEAFLYHLKVSQCFLLFNLISCYFHTCVDLTSPRFTAWLTELHKCFLETPTKRRGVIGSTLPAEVCSYLYTALPFCALVLSTSFSYSSTTHALVKSNFVVRVICLQDAQKSNFTVICRHTFVKHNKYMEW